MCRAMGGVSVIRDGDFGWLGDGDGRFWMFTIADVGLSDAVCGRGMDRGFCDRVIRRFVERIGLPIFGWVFRGQRTKRWMRTWRIGLAGRW